MSAVSQTSQVSSLYSIGESSQFGKIAQFKEKMQEAVSRETLDRNNWGSEIWKELAHLIDDEIIQDAFSNIDKIKEQLDIPQGLSLRTPKTLKRVGEKIGEQWPNSPENYFKVVSDLLAARIVCNVSDIKGIVEQLRDKALEKGGSVYIRGQSDTDLGDSLKGGKFTNLVQFIYIYLPEIGYPIEFQIGHPFTEITFKMDSARRTALKANPELPKTQKPLSFWDKGSFETPFYVNMETFMLARLNGSLIDEQMIQQKEVELVKQAKEIHEDRYLYNYNGTTERVAGVSAEIFEFIKSPVVQL